MKFIAYIVGFIVFVAMILIFNQATPYSVSKDGNALTLTSNSKLYSFTYDVLPYTSIEGRVIHYEDAGGIEEGGIRAELHYLSEEKYEEYRSFKGCRGAFLNNNARVLFLIPDKSTVASTLSSLSFSRGDSFMIAGEPLAFISAHVHGQDRKILNDHRFQYFLPSHLNRNTSPLF